MGALFFLSAIEQVFERGLIASLCLSDHLFAYGAHRLRVLRGEEGLCKLGDLLVERNIANSPVSTQALHQVRSRGKCRTHARVIELAKVTFLQNGPP